MIDEHSLMAMRKTNAVTESKILSHLRLRVSFNTALRFSELTVLIADRRRRIACR